jgi:hypothetical protein
MPGSVRGVENFPSPFAWDLTQLLSLKFLFKLVVHDRNVI